MPAKGENCMWGIFKVHDSIIHVAPVKDDDTIKEPHELHDFCPCQPTIEYYKFGMALVRHNQIN